MKKHGPWTIKESTEKYKNKWITVTEHQVIRPDGKDGIFGVVEMLPGISVLPIDDLGMVHLTKEFRFAIGKESIESVSGGIDNTESPLDAAKRELLEETGLKATTWVSLGEVHPFTSVIHSPATLFLAQDLEDTRESHEEGTEIIDTLKVSLAQALGMVLKGEIIHSQTCTLILKANEYLKTN